jgi:hypothetical protein
MADQHNYRDLLIIRTVAGLGSRDRFEYHFDVKFIVRSLLSRVEDLGVFNEDVDSDDKVIEKGVVAAKSYWKTFEKRITDDFLATHVTMTPELATKFWKKLSREVKLVIGDVVTRKIILRDHKTKYVSYGIGCGSDEPSCRSDPRSYLQCEEDMQLMRSYSSTYNYFLGSTLENGSSPCVGNILFKIRHACVCAFEVGAHAVIYFTGHADDDGDWGFHDGFITLGMVVQSISMARAEVFPPATEKKVFIIADCCQAGKWCEEIEHDNILVIAAAGTMNTAKDQKFARAFFSLGKKQKVKMLKNLSVRELNRKFASVLHIESRDTVSDAEFEDVVRASDNETAENVRRAMSCKPTIGAHGRSKLLKQSYLDEHLWFNCERKEVDWFN